MGNMGKHLVAIAMMAVCATSAVRADARPARPLVVTPQAIERGLAAAPSVVRAGQSSPARHTGRRIAWTVVGAVGGFFGGALLGSAIDARINDCHCDDPGLKGFLIGMPVGAIAGGVAGFVLSK